MRELQETDLWGTLLSWDTQGLLSAVKTNGTLNHPGDVDQGWSVEMAIPLGSLSFWGDRPVRDGDQWEHNWVWSPQGIIDMHAPEKWAYLQFSMHGGGVDTVAFVVPADAGAREMLWMLYGAQQKYLRQHGHYANSVAELGVKDGGEIKMEATDLQFIAAIGAPGRMLSIDQDGEVRKPGERD